MVGQAHRGKAVFVDLQRIGDARYELGESPVWDHRNGVLYFVDAAACAVLCYDPESGKTRRWDVDGGYLGAMALCEEGGVVVVMDNGFHRLDLETGATVALAEPEAVNAETGFNDCKVDRQGRLVGGSLHTGASEPRGSVYRLDADHTCTRIDTGLIESNGPCFSPDGRTFYIADSYAEVIYAYDCDPVSGDASNRRVFYSSAGTGGQPDGATVDAEGHVWSAQFGAGKIHRIAPDGSVVRSIDVPVKWVSCMTFAGPDIDTMYVTSIGCEIAGERDDSPEAGGLFVIRGLGVQGLPEPRFAG